MPQTRRRPGFPTARPCRCQLNGYWPIRSNTTENLQFAPHRRQFWRTAELGLARGLLGSRRRLLGTVFAPLWAGVGEFALWRRRICQNNAEKRP